VGVRGAWLWPLCGRRAVAHQGWRWCWGPQEQLGLDAEWPQTLSRPPALDWLNGGEAKVCAGIAELTGAAKRGGGPRYSGLGEGPSGWVGKRGRCQKGWLTPRQGIQVLATVFLCRPPVPPGDQIKKTGKIPTICVPSGGGYKCGVRNEMPPPHISRGKENSNVRRRRGPRSSRAPVKEIPRRGKTTDPTVGRKGTTGPKKRDPKLKKTVVVGETGTHEKRNPKQYSGSLLRNEAEWPRKKETCATGFRPFDMSRTRTVRDVGGSKKKKTNRLRGFRRPTSRNWGGGGKAPLRMSTRGGFDRA